MAYEHGISILENPTSLTPPIKSSVGLQVVVGTAPVNLAKDIDKAVNVPILAYSWAEAIENLGYSDDWGGYTLCQSMDASFRQFNVAPVIFINVLDPSIHKTAVSSVNIELLKGNGRIETFGILIDSVIVKSSDGTTTYTKDEDYSIAFDKDGYPVVSIIPSGTIVSDTTELNVAFDKLDPSLVTKDDIIGGYDVTNNKYLGLELIAQIYPKLGLVPGQLLAPGWSHIPEVASVMDAKCKKINGSFNCTNLLDIDSEVVTSYQDAPEWKSNNSYGSEHSIICYPKAEVGDKEYWLSAIIGALTAYTDAVNDDVPYKSPSNKKLPITGTVLADGTEMYLDQMQANFLNGAGIMTAINVNGWRSWGNNTAAYPSTTDPKDRFISIRRVFDWWGNTFIQTFFSKVDEPANTRLIENIVDSENIRGNGFQAKGQIAGAKIEFRQEDNPTTDILNGRIQFIQKIGAFPPAEHIVNVLEFDPTILTSTLFGGE